MNFRGFSEFANPFEKLHKIIDLTLDWILDNADFWRLYASLLMQEETKAIVEKVAGNFMEELFNEMEKIFRKIKIKNPSAEARIFGAIIDGMSFHILFMGKASLQSCRLASVCLSRKCLPLHLRGSLCALMK